jgi:hypothetical protein
MADGDHPRPVAVVAVHGVGYCPPFSIARHISSMLLGLGRLRLDPVRTWPLHDDAGNQLPPIYDGCREVMIQVPLKRAPVGNASSAEQRTPVANASWMSRALHFWDERRGYVADAFTGRIAQKDLTADLADRGKLAHEFMRAQLAGYVSTDDGQAYDTIRLETERKGATAEQNRTVHIYETYWADLSRPQGSILSFLTALYQLLFHLGSLSRTALDYAALEHLPRKSWKWLSFWQAMAVRFLVVPVPILNLLLLIAGLTVLPLKININHGIISATLVGLTLLVVALFRPRRVHPSYRVWIAILALFSLSGFLGSLLSLRWIPARGSRALAAHIFLSIEWWLLGAALLFLLMSKYERVRRGAFLTSVVLYALSLTAFIAMLAEAARLHLTNPVEQAAFWTLQIIMLALVLSWVFFLFSGLLAWSLHALCLFEIWWRGGRNVLYARACAALRTGRLALAVSASIFMLTTVFLWAGAFAYTSKQFSLYTEIALEYPPVPQPLLSVVRFFLPSGEDAFRWIHRQQVDTAEFECKPGDPNCHQERIEDERIRQPKQCSAYRAGEVAALDLKGRLENVRLALYRQNLAAPITDADGTLEERVVALESLLRVVQQRSTVGMPLDCESRVYHLEVKAGLTTESEFSIYARSMMLTGDTSGLPLTLVLVILSIMLLTWAVARSLLVAGPKLNTPPGPGAAVNRRCAELGDWLSRGLDSTRVVTGLFWHSIFTVAVIFGSLDFLYAHGLLTWHPLLLLDADFNHASLEMLNLVGAWLALSGVAIATIVYKYGRVALDILLDVDNYLRTSPLDNSPRARIAERYVSLLRYIAAQKDEHGEPLYASVVIVAHSLGSLISADLLHYLKREPDPELLRLGYGEAEQKKCPVEIRLLTFGNPIRQLLNRFFPHLYWWIREEPDNGARPLPPATFEPPSITATKQGQPTPNPSDLGVGVKLWFNAYRSGDFVGRMLWSDHWYCRTDGGPPKGTYPEPVKIIVDSPDDKTPPTRAEMCIGLGGHNDYWNRTAPDMAEQLDNLIQM